MSEGTTQSDSCAAPSQGIESARSAVTAALGRVENGQRDALEELRQALCAYVEVLRRAGQTRDAVLSEIRQIMAQPATPGGAYSLRPIVREALAELTLEWCRAEYARMASD
jgi:hypothetical protein